MSNHRWRRRIACLAPIALLAGTLASACDANGAFPDALPCDPPQPTARPNRTVNPQVFADNVYRRLTRDGLTAIESTSSSFRTEWPFERPSSNLEFRQAFVDYTRTITCTAAYLRDLEPGSDALQEFDTAYDALMTETIELAEFGQESVRSRNTSKFKEWIKRLEAMPSRFDEVLGKLPAQ